MTEGKNFRETARELLRSAAELGMGEAHRLLFLTPWEIELCFQALAARRQAELERSDLLGWLAGRYALIGFHAPKRYPRRPDAVQKRPARMSDGQMKQVFAAMAARKEEGDGGC
ncbi:MAG: hypothetical protein IJ466_12595 [Clostridia bacterium]|nr:hypothetical protein [Clostridia bacterium]